ncbi:MAG: dTDP-4-dehydrorhamnose reductase [Gemmataceae bacterium]|nr:dTDP-4-dehydrorhamnose reductase [Gemmataceae bacterium]
MATGIANYEFAAAAHPGDVMEFLVLGAGGQLAQGFLRRLGDRAAGLTRAEADLTKPDQLQFALANHQPRIVLNCASYNWVDQAEKDRSTPFDVNAWGVRALADACRARDCVLVHYSTNYVFGLDGERRTPYQENDPPGPVSVYGMSKLAGEYFARLCPRHFVIRTCGLFGKMKPGGSRVNFVDRMLNLARQNQTIRVVNDQVCAPTKVEDLVDASLRLVETERYGLYHLTSAGACTWHEFTLAMLDIAGQSADVRGLSSAEFGAAAQRPKYSVLANDAYARLGFRPLRNWRAALANYLQET